MFNTPEFPKVSIIMPTYNRAKLISEAIQSILDQTYTDWQLIIVDDGSDDDTEEVVAAFAEARMEFIKVGRTNISGKIKNIGLQKATGDLVAFLDSDDLWAATKLEKQINVLRSYPEAGFSLTGGYNFEVTDQPLEFFYKERSGIKYGELFLDYFKSELSAFTQALMLRKECMDAVGLFKESKAFSDIDFIVTLAGHFKAIVLYEPLVYRRRHNLNWIDANWINSYNEGIDIIKEYKKELPSALFADALFRLYINFGENYLTRRESAKAAGKFIHAWQYRPLSFIPTKKIGKALVRKVYAGY